MLVRLKRRDDGGDPPGSSFLRAPVQSQGWNKEKEYKHHPQVCEKVQGNYPEVLLVYLKPFAEPWAIGMPQGQGDNPVEEGEEDPNSEGA